MNDETLHAIEERSDGIPDASDVVEHQVASERHTQSVVAAPQSVNESLLQIAFSVYTAENGYDWSNIPEGSDHEGLDFYYQKAVECKPDFMSSGDVVKGVFARDGNVAAFRIQVVKQWDSFGRDADYCAFAFLTYEDAWRVDFEALLNMPEFTEPRHDPPASISYFGEASKDINSEESVDAIQKLYHRESLQSFDFAKIGALLSTHGNKSDSWLFCKVECAIESSTIVSTGDWIANPYPPPPPVESPEPAEKTLHESFTSEQRIESIEMPIQAQVSMPSSQPASCTQQATPRTVVVDARLRMQNPAAVFQNAYKPPMTGLIHSVHDNSCVTTKVSNEEMRRISDAIKHKSNGWFGFDTLTVVLLGVCVILVAVILCLVFYLFLQNGTVDVGVSIGKEQSVLKADESRIREIKPLDDAKADLGLEKGGK